MSWWIITGLIIALVVVFFKANHIKHGLSSYLLIFVLIFLIASASYVYMTNNIDLSSFDGVVQGGKVYFSWVEGIFHNTGKITAYAVNQNWGLNSTIK